MTDEELERRVVDLEHQVETLKREQREREIKQLRYGITALGAIVLAMGSWIWGQVQHLVTLNVGK